MLGSNTNTNSNSSGGSVPALSRDLSAARAAFDSSDAALSRAAHTPSSYRHHLNAAAAAAAQSTANSTTVTSPSSRGAGVGAGAGAVTSPRAGSEGFDALDRTGGSRRVVLSPIHNPGSDTNAHPDEQHLTPSISSASSPISAAHSPSTAGDAGTGIANGSNASSSAAGAVAHTHDHNYTPVFEPGHGRPASSARKSFRAAVIDGLSVSVCLSCLCVTLALTTAQTTAMLIAGTLGLAVSFALRDYVRYRSDQEHYTRERARETWELENYEEGEAEEMIELYMSKGVSEADAVAAISALSKYKTFFVDLMMTQELELEIPDSEPIANAGATLVGFLVSAAVPLATLLFTFRYTHWTPAALRASVLSVCASVWDSRRYADPSVMLQTLDGVVYRLQSAAAAPSSSSQETAGGLSVMVRVLVTLLDEAVTLLSHPAGWVFLVCTVVLPLILMVECFTTSPWKPGFRCSLCGGCGGVRRATGGLGSRSGGGMGSDSGGGGVSGGGSGSRAHTTRSSRRSTASACIWTSGTVLAAGTASFAVAHYLLCRSNANASVSGTA